MGSVLVSACLSVNYVDSKWENVVSQIDLYVPKSFYSAAVSCRWHKGLFGHVVSSGMTHGLLQQLCMFSHLFLELWYGFDFVLLPKNKCFDLI